MDKQAWIAVTLCIVGLFAWQYWFTTKYPVTNTAAHPAAATTTAGSPAPGAAPTAAPVAGKPVPSEVVTVNKEPVPAADSTPEKIEVVTTPQIELHFTNLGGGIAEAIPLGKEHLAENGVNIKLNRAGETAIGALSAHAGQDTRLPYNLVSREGNTIRYERTEPDGLKITKEYTLDWQGDNKQIPAVDLKVTFTNTGAQPYRNDGYYVAAGAAAPIHARDLPTYTSFDWLSGGSYHTDHASSFDAGRIPLVGYETHPARAVITESLGKVAWVAVKNQFYTTILTPLGPNPGEDAPASGVWARRFDVLQTGIDTPLHGVDVALGLPGLTLDPGASATQNFQIYAGPKFYSRLEKLGHNEQEVMDFGKFKIVSITLLALMNTFKKWFGGYGIAIIVLTILVKAVLFPLQNKANKSMKRMSMLSPKMTELREKFKDDPARLNKETMALYKQYGVNPVGGCLPMLVQMPIFFGFLYMLYTAAELRNSSFLWVKDLAQPDTVAHLAGFPINVLPILMIGTQFWQMSMTPKTGDASQQKTMMFMPLLFGFFCYNFAAALALYYTMQGLLTILQLRLTRNQAPPTLDEGGSTAKFVPVKGGGGPGFGGGKRGGAPRRLKT